MEKPHVRNFRCRPDKSGQALLRRPTKTPGMRTNLHLTLLRVRPAAVLPALTVALGLETAPALAGLPESWRFESALPQGNDLLAIWAASPDAVFAGGHGGTLLRWNGSAWTRMPTPSQKTIFALHGLSTTDVWAVGGDAYTDRMDDRSLFLHFNGTSWTEVPPPQFGNTTYVFNSVHAVAPNDVWATQDSGTFLAHFNGTAWDWVSVPLPVEGSFRAVTSAGPDHLFVVGTHGQILHRDHGVWKMEQKLQSGSFTTSILNAVWAHDATHVFAAGNWSQLFRREPNGTWTALPIGPSQPFGFGFLNIWGTSPTNVFLADPQGIFHSDGSNPATRTNLETGIRRYWSAACGAGDRLFAVGSGGTVHEFKPRTGTAGGILSALTTGGQAELPISVRGAAAAGARGVVVHGFASSAAGVAPLWYLDHGVAFRWPVLPGGMGNSVDIKAATASGPDDVLIAWENFDNFTRAVHRWDGTQWHALPGAEGTLAFSRTPSGTLYAASQFQIWKWTGSWELVYQTPFDQFDTVFSGLWAASDTSLFAIAENGRILHFNGTTWAFDSVPGSSRLTGIAGNGTDTYAVGLNGAAWRRVGSAWQPVQGVAAVADENFLAIAAGPDGIYASQRTPGGFIGGGLGRLWRFNGNAATLVAQGLSQPLEALVRTSEGHLVGLNARDYILTTAPDSTGTHLQRLNLAEPGWQPLGTSDLAVQVGSPSIGTPVAGVRRVRTPPPFGPKDYAGYWQLLEERFNTGSSLPPLRVRLHYEPDRLSPGVLEEALALFHAGPPPGEEPSVADPAADLVTGLAAADRGAWTLAKTSQPAGPPALQIEPGAAPNVTISWPASASGYQLHSSPSLGSGAEWTRVTEPVSSDGTRNRVSLPATSGTRFFRLQR